MRTLSMLCAAAARTTQRRMVIESARPRRIAKPSHATLCTDDAERFSDFGGSVEVPLERERLVQRPFGLFPIARLHIRQAEMCVEDRVVWRSLHGRFELLNRRRQHVLLHVGRTDRVADVRLG